MSTDSDPQQLLDGSPVDSPTDDWPSRLSTTIVDYVEQVRDKTTGPALVASRTAVYMTAIALVAIVLLLLILLGLFRLLVVASGELLPFVEPGESWLAFYVLGGIFLIAGAFLWRKKDQ